MSINHNRPRQDRRNVGRSPVKRHARVPSACTETDTPAFSPSAKITRAQKAALIQSRRKDIQCP
jgi:hypothetical protein